MIKITSRNLAEFFGVEPLTVKRWAEKNGGLKDFDGTILTIVELAEKYGAARKS